jgi:hypothetical protein
MKKMKAIESFAFDYYQGFMMRNQLNYRTTKFAEKNNFAFRHLLSIAVDEWE